MVTATRKKRVRQDLGKKVTVARVERLSMKDALEQAALSKTSGSWSAIRMQVQQVLQGKLPPTQTETVAIVWQIDGRDPVEKEARSMEVAINSWLQKDAKSQFRVKYLETQKKIIILHEAQYRALFLRRAHSQP